MFVDPCIVVQFLQWKPQQNVTVYQNLIIPCFKWSSTCFGRHTASHQEPKLHTQPLVLHTWKVVGRAVVGRCQVAYATWQLHVRQPSTYAKPEAACAVLGSWWWTVCRPKHVELYLKIRNNKNFDTLLHLVGFSMWISFSVV